MFGFIKKAFVVAITFFSCNALECVSVNNQGCKIRPQMLNINNDDIFFYPYSIQVNKCSGSCNNIIKNPYAKLCATDFVKNINVKAFNLVSKN